MEKNTFIILLAFMGFFCFFACNKEMENSNDGFHFDEKTFTSEWNGWKNNHIQNYSFTLTGTLPYWNFLKAIPMHEYTVNIIVKNGIMDSFEYIGGVPHKENENSILEPEFTSIDDIYQKISDKAKEEREWWKRNTGGRGIISTKYEVKYSPTLHYITSFEPVSKWESGWIVDATTHAVSIYNFTVLDSK